MATAAELLEGRTLDGGWTVLRKLEAPPAATGGHFSTGYIVETETGRQGYLKALDWERAMNSDADPVSEVRRMTNAFYFERTVLETCRERRMDRVVLAIDHGRTRVTQPQGSTVVPYLIFELADADVRSAVAEGRLSELFWILETLHHIATGLQQLHSATIAHQDLKPSNVLVFDRSNERKLADLGRAAYKGHSPPHDSLRVAGDKTYAPLELLYGQIDPDWTVRRYGCDAYLLGSMAVFLFLGQGTTPLVISELNEAHRPGRWPSSFGSVLPYVRDAFGRVIRKLEKEVPEALRPEFIPLVRHLCDPDPRLRGHPKDRAGRGNQYSLRRFVTAFDLMAKRALAGYYG